MSKPGKELALVETRPETLLDSLFEEALTCGNAEQAWKCLDVIERLYPEMHEQAGKAYAFTWPECPEYVPQIPPSFYGIRPHKQMTAAESEERRQLLLRDDDTILSEGSPRFRDLFDDTIKTDPI